MTDHIPECIYGPEFCDHDAFLEAVLAALEEEVAA